MVILLQNVRVPVLMKDGRNILHGGLQYHIRAKTADLYKLMGKERVEEVVCIQSTKQGCIQ